MKTFNKILIAVGSGIVAGGLLGILFAPRKGSKTRRIIKEEGEKFLDQFKHVVDENIEKRATTPNRSRAGAYAEEIEKKN